MDIKKITETQKDLFRIGNAVSDLEEFNNDWEENQAISFSTEWAVYMAGYSRLVQLAKDGQLTIGENRELGLLQSRMKKVLPAIKQLKLFCPMDLYL